MEKKTRLIAEAEFQDKRENTKKEPRDAFEYLSGRASDIFFDVLKSNANGKILVAGCATGTVTPLAKLGYSVVGVDISPVAIEKLNKAIHREGLSELATAIVGDAEEPDFKPGQFDLICCSGALHHLDITKAIESWEKLLKSNGKIVFVEPQKLNPFAALYRWFTPDQHTEDEHPLAPSDIRYLESKFRIKYHETINFLTPLSLIFSSSHKFNRVKYISAEILYQVDKYLFSTLPLTKHLAWSVVLCLEKIE